MTAHRTIIRIVVLVCGLWAVTPAIALANPLLSGYGAPGVGNQAILGSALLNTPRGGAGGSGTGTAGSTGEGGLSSATGGATSNGRPSGSRAATGGSGERSSAPASSTAQAQGLQGAAEAYRTLERTASASPSGTLSVQDFVYIALALCALAFTGAITRRLTRTTPAGKHG
jgi:hypothetical protein